MPKVDFGFDVEGVDATAGFDTYDGPLPPNGSYLGVLKIVQPKPIANGKNKGATRFAIGVELTHPDYAGYLAWGGVNLIESGKGFVSQFLKALTDGSEVEFDAVRRAFSRGQIVLDPKKENITKIGKHKIDSPKGELPIMVTLKQREYNGKISAGIQEFLSTQGMGDGSGTEVIDDDAEVEDDGLESDEDDETADETETDDDGDEDGEAEGDGEGDDAEDEDSDEDSEVDDSIFDEE